MAANNIGRWSVQAGIDATGMAAGADKSIAEAKRMQGELNRIGGAVKMPGGLTMFANLPTAMIVAKGQQLAQDFTKEIDDNLDLGFLNNRLGTSVEWLSALQTVARETNISAQSFAGGMDRLNMKIGEASLGGEEAQRAFRTLGLEWDVLATQGFDKNLMAVANAFTQIESRAERARIAQQLFGRLEGQRMLRLMEMGSGGLGEALADVRSRGGFITSDQLSRLQAADDAFDRMATASANGWRNFVVAIAPTVTGVLNEWNRAMGEIDRSIMRLTAPSVTTRAQQLLQSMTPATAPAAIDPMTAALMAQAFPASLFPEAPNPVSVADHEALVEQRRAEAGEARIALHERANEHARAEAERVRMRNAGGGGLFGPSEAQQQAMDAARLAHNHLETATNNAAEAARQLAEAEAALASAREREQMQQQARNRDRIAENQRAILRDIDEADRITEQSRTPLEMFGTRMERLQELFDSGNLTEQAFNRASRDARRGMLGQMFGGASEASSPLLGGLSAGSSEAAAIIQGSLTPQVDQLAAIAAGIEAQREAAERTREIQEQLLALFESGELRIYGISD